MQVQKFSSLDDLAKYLREQKMKLEDLAQMPTTKLAKVFHTEDEGCRYCNRPLFTEDDELQDGFYCTKECVRLHAYEVVEAAATGN